MVSHTQSDVALPRENYGKCLSQSDIQVLLRQLPTSKNMHNLQYWCNFSVVSISAWMTFKSCGDSSHPSTCKIFSADATLSLAWCFEITWYSTSCMMALVIEMSRKHMLHHTWCTPSDNLMMQWYFYINSSLNFCYMIFRTFLLEAGSPNCISLSLQHGSSERMEAESH